MHEFYALEGSYKLHKKRTLSWDSVAGTVFRLRARHAANRDLFPGRGTSFFPSPKHQQRTLDPRQPPVHCGPGTFPPGVKWPEREAALLPAYGG